MALGKKKEQGNRSEKKKAQGGGSEIGWLLLGILGRLLAASAFS